MTWPDLLIVGAPKCGTTAITRFLETHPQVHMAERKDLHFFGTDLGFQHRERESEASYLNRFEAAQPSQLRAESSVWYLYSTHAAAEIAEKNPEARILILLRHPVDMMHALWAQLRLNGLGDEDITDFAAALEAEEDRIGGQRIPASTPLPEALFYRRTARYAEQIRRYSDVFPSEQIQVIIQEEMKADTQAAWAEVCDWLDIDAGHQPEIGQVNRSKAVRSEGLRRAVGATPQGVKKLLPSSARRTVSRWLRKVNSSHTQRAPLEPALRSKLNTEFKREVKEVEAILGRTIPSWSR
jgi:hypothetical protein